MLKNITKILAKKSNGNKEKIPISTRSQAIGSRSHGHIPMMRYRLNSFHNDDFNIRNCVARYLLLSIFITNSAHVINAIYNIMIPQSVLLWNNESTTYRSCGYTMNNHNIVAKIVNLREKLQNVIFNNHSPRIILNLIFKTINRFNV